MNYIAMDTSGKHLTVIACKDGKLTVSYDVDCALKHSVTLMNAVESAAEKAELDISSVDFFACVVGAGSFTGIRISVATVKALCFAYGKPCLPITSFDTMAYNKIGGKILTVIDAKHNGYYVCGYDGESVILPPAYMSGEELSSIKKGYKVVSAEKIAGLKCVVSDVVKGLATAIENKKSSATLDLESVNPLYVRKSQAEEGR